MRNESYANDGLDHSLFIITEATKLTEKFQEPLLERRQEFEVHCLFLFIWNM